MSAKHVLIVDDETSILAVLKNSLKKLGPDYRVVAVTDGFAALDQLRERPFDLVISDYRMADMDGLELLEAIRYLQPKARIIMMTAYHNSILAAEVQKLQAFRYLTKPLDINHFRQVVREALGDRPPERSEVLLLSEERYQQVHQLLERLRMEVNARCILLADADGRAIARIGDTDKTPMDQVTSLLGGGIATLIEAGRVLDGEVNTVNLAYREGKQEYLYAINVGQQLLMILIIDRGPYSSRLGAVWYYVQQTALTLGQIMEEAEYANPQQVFHEAIDQAFDIEMDKLFDTDE